MKPGNLLRLLSVFCLIFTLLASSFAQIKPSFQKQKRIPIQRKGAMVPLQNGQNEVKSAANNTCAGATSLVYNVPFIDNNIGNTESRAPIACNGFISPVANDVWFKFVYTIQMDSLKVIPQNDDAYDIVLELFSGTCANLTTIGCSDFAEPNSNNQTEGFLLSSYGLTPGTTYYFRVYGWNGTECNFTAWLKSGIPLPPNNDQCAASTQLFAGSTVGGTTVSATQSLAPSTCGGFTSTSGNDVWFRFLKSASMDSLIVYPDISSLDLILEIRSGTCAASSSVSCSDGTGNGGIEKLSVAGLVNGTTYLVRVYGYNGSSGDFAIKLKAAPTNDNCSGALLISPQTTCPNPTNYTTIDASQSLAAISCGGFTGIADDDVWFRFVAAGNIDSLFVYPNGTFDPVVDLRSGTCTSSATIRCSDDPNNAAAIEKIYVGGLTIGTTYYVRVYSYNNIAGSQGTFRICLRQTTVSLPPNDECPSSSLLSPGGIVNSGTSVNATQSIPAVLCGGFTSSAANDVWYQFLKTDQVDTILVTPNGTFDPVAELRNNACSNGNTLACSDNLNQTPEKIAVDGLTNGETYLIRIYGWAGTTGTFGIQLIDAISAAANDECFTPYLLTVSTTCTPTSGSNIGSTQSQDPGACSGAGAGVANDVWYTFTATGPQAIVKLGCGVGFDGAVEVFSGGCFNLNSIGCADVFGPSTGTATATETINLTGLTTGQFYFVRVYGYQGAIGTFDLCVYNPACNSAVGNLTLSKSTIISNEAFSFTVTGVNGVVDVEYSSDQINWTPLGLSGNLTDTLIGTSSPGATLFLRATNQDGSCFPSISPVKSLVIRCATRLTNSSIISGDYIRRIQISNLDKISTTNPLGGSVEDFSSNTPAITVCRTNSYPLIFTANKANQAYNRLAWIDFNQDGDFEDAGENVYFGTYIAGLTVTGSCSIPANAQLGNTKMRVALINNGATLATSNPCATGPYISGEFEEYAITISSGISANAGPNQTICATSATLAGNDPGAGNSGIWTVVSGTGTFENASAFNTLVIGLSAGANVFRWTINGSCGSTQAQVTITRNAISANAGTDQSVCAANANLNAAAPSNGTGIWSVFTGGATLANPGLRTSGVSNLSIGLNQFIWTVSQAGCTPATDTVSILRSADPSEAIAGPAQTICVNTTQLAGNTAQVGTGIWTVVQGTGTFENAGNPTTLVSGINQGINRYRWTITSGNCTPKFSEVTVTVVEAPVANAGQNQNICAQNATLAGNTPAASTYLWNLYSGSGQITNPGNGTTTVTGLGIGVNVFTYTVTRGTCPPSTDTVVIIRKAPPVSDAGQNQTVCSANATLSATPPISGTGVWTVVSGTGTITTPTNPFSAVTNLGTGANVFRWTVSDAPCTPATSEVTITRQAPGVTANAGNDATICDANYTLVGNAPGTGTGIWTVVSGSGTLANPGNPSTGVSALGVGINIFRWTISNGNCPPSFDDVVVTRKNTTTLANAGPNQTICANTATLAANSPSQGTGVWSVVSGSGQFADPTNPNTTVSGLTIGANTFRWTISNTPCPSSTSDVTITTSGNATTASTGPAQVICADASNLSGNTPAQGTGLWTLISGSGTIAEPTNPTSAVSGLGVGINVFRWTISSGACPSTSADLTLTRKAQPQTPNAGNNQTICGATTTLSATNPTIGTGIWSLVSGTGTLIDPNASTTQVVGLGSGTNVFRYTVSNPPCGAVSADVSVTTTLSVPSSNAGPDQTICLSSATLSGNQPSPGAGVWTVVSGSGTFANPTSPTTAVSNLGTGDNVFRWSITSGTCPASTDEVTITLKSSPSQANAGNDQSICGATATLGANSPTSGIGQWSLVSGQGTFIDANSPNTQVINMGAGVNVFRWTISNSPCPASQATVSITSTPSNLVANAGTDQTVCSGNATLIAVAPPVGNGAWSLISGTGLVQSPGQAVSPVTGLSSGTNQFLWTVTNGSCTATDVVVLTVETNPINLKDSIVCVEQATSITLNGPAGMGSYLWNTNANSQNIVVSSSGTYYLRVLTLNGCVFTDTSDVTFTICTSTNPILDNHKLKADIFPNPSQEQASIRIQSPLEEELTVEILDMKGVKLNHFSTHIGEGNNQISLPFGKIPSGTYVVKMAGKTGVTTLKWVITR